MDEDAAAFRAFLDSERDSKTRLLAAERAATVPLDIGRACARIVELARVIQSHASGAMQLDVATAREMAAATARSALDIAEHNLEQVSDAPRRQEIRGHIEQLRHGV